MKSNILLLFVFLFSLNVSAIELYISADNLGNPTYLRDSKITVFLNEETTQKNNFFSVSLEINYLQDSKSLYLQKYDFSYDEVSYCRENKRCDSTVPLLIGLLNRTCKVKVSLVTSAGEILAEKGLNWGQCRKSHSRPVDLNIENLNLIVQEVDDADLPTEISPYNKIALQGLDLNYQYIVVGRDFEGEVIYSGRKYADSRDEFFPENISPFVHSRLCSLEFFADPYVKIKDENLSNNVRKISFGNCQFKELDELPDLLMANNETDLFIYNKNDFLYRFEQIDLDFELYDNNNFLIFKFRRNVLGNLNFYEFSTYNYEHLFANEGCLLKITVNPDGAVLEENFINNELVINRCTN